MEVLLLLVLVVVLFVVLSVKRSISDQISGLNAKVDALSRLVQKLEQRKASAEDPSAAKEKSTEKRESTPLPPMRDPVVRAFDAGKRITEEKTPEEDVKKEVTPIVSPLSTPAPVTAKVQPPKVVRPSFFERNPDLEKFIGENLANKIGIAILVIGIGFFVKYAIDQDWINEIGRVFVGILCGGILIAVAHRLRKTFSAFSSVLVGGGIAVLYFTIAIAFHEYQIFSQTAAFSLMVIITAFTIVLSLGYDRIELAVVAILGGFGSPFMVSTGEGNYIVLFSYMLILNGGMLVLAYHKKWRLVNIISYVFTILIFGGWLSTRFESDNSAMISGALIFATLFYLIFFMMNIINNLKLKTKFEAVEITMLLSNTFLYYSAGMFLLHHETVSDWRGLFTTLLAVFNFIFAYSLYKNASADRNLVFMLIGLVLTFISLAAPIQLEGNHITLFWAAESVLLLWLSQKSGIRLMAIASVIVSSLMLASLSMDWKQIYLEADYAEHLRVIFNKGYVAGFVVILSLFFLIRLLQRSSTPDVIKPKQLLLPATLVLFVVLYFVNLLELRYQLLYYVNSHAARGVIVGTYNMAFILMILLVSQRMSLPKSFSTITLPAFGAIAIGSYLFLYHSFVVDARDELLFGLEGMTGFLFHYILVALLIAVVVRTLQVINRDNVFATSIYNAHWWIIIFLFVFLASAELDHTVLLTANADSTSTSRILSSNHKIGFPILWGVTSFLLIAIGLSRKLKILRIISLVLLLITLLKLFIIDLRDISEGGKIAAFISLGVLLLIVSFMYQRLKKLLLEDKQTDEEKVV